MTKQTGMGAALWVDGIDVSGDIASLETISSSRAVLPLTGLPVSAMERGHGLRDGGFEITSWFNKAAGQSHPTFRALGSGNSRIATYAHRTVINAPAASMQCKQFSYDGSRGEDAALVHKITASADAFGLDWTQLLTAGKRTDGGATNGTGVDWGATVGTTAFGLQAYLHVFAFTGTSATIKIQESSDNAVGDAYADVVGGGFTAVTTAPQAQRIATSPTLTVERWLRVVTTGTFSSLVFAVGVKKNLASPAL